MECSKTKKPIVLESKEKEKNKAKSKNKRMVNNMKIVFLSCCSVTIELENNDIYFSNEPYDIYLNNEKIFSSYNKNVFSIFDLTPNTKYDIKINNEIFSFVTESASNIIDVYPNKINDNDDNRLFIRLDTMLVVWHTLY